uniref:Uncharacterized protein n=1 Tax=Anopheles atroparvus TaxID=41427 RepID=A0AAG5DL22_ANOAO
MDELDSEWFAFLLVFATVARFDDPKLMTRRYVVVDGYAWPVPPWTPEFDDWKTMRFDIFHSQFTLGTVRGPQVVSCLYSQSVTSVTSFQQVHMMNSLSF